VHLKSDAAGVPTCICTAETVLSDISTAVAEHRRAPEICSGPAAPGHSKPATKLHDSSTKTAFDFVPVSNKYALACRSTG